MRLMTTSTLDLPIISLLTYIGNPTSSKALAECKRAADALVQFSAFAIQDARVSQTDNNRFLDLMEDYFDQPYADKMHDVRPQYHYQVGPTPELTEVPKCGNDSKCQEMVKQMHHSERPLDFTGADPKWRFFWRIGDRPSQSQFHQLNADPVCPAAFPQWSQEMNHWGNKMFDAVFVLSEMLAIGFGLPKDAFSALMKNGPHLLAPTGSNLEKYGQVGRVLAGFHYDLNFLTIHGKSRFPGLNIWTRQGKKMAAKIPDGCLLIQAGKQMEWLTGGSVGAGYHEVVVNEKTLEALEKQVAASRPKWRISSTLFSHIASDNILEPIGHFAKQEASRLQYPATLAGTQVQMELGLINLLQSET